MADMFVIIEWNQASHQPRLAADVVYDSAADAEEAAGPMRTEMAGYGRRERYTVHAVEDEPVESREAGA